MGIPWEPLSHSPPRTPFFESPLTPPSPHLHGDAIGPVLCGQGVGEASHEGLSRRTETVPGARASPRAGAGMACQPTLALALPAPRTLCDYRGQHLPCLPEAPVSHTSTPPCTCSQPPAGPAPIHVFPALQSPLLSHNNKKPRLGHTITLDAAYMLRNGMLRKLATEERLMMTPLRLRGEQQPVGRGEGTPTLQKHRWDLCVGAGT